MITKKQAEVLKEISDGVPYYHNAITTYRPYTKNGFGYDAEMVHGAVMNNLEKMNLIRKDRHNTGGLYRYSLTDNGREMLEKKGQK